MALNCNLQTIFLKSLIILCTILILTFGPILAVFIFLPLHCIRWFVSILAKKLRPDFVKIVSRRSLLFVSDLQRSKPNCTNLGVFIIENDVNLTEFQETIQSNLINAKSSSYHELYPELQQYITKWCCYYFWTPEPLFDVKAHVKLLPNIYYSRRLNKSNQTTINQNDLEEICSRVITEPFPSNFSPWEIFLVPNYEVTPEQGTNEMKHESNIKSNTALIIRSHHVLADGQSTLKVIDKLINGLELDKLNQIFKTRTTQEDTSFVLLGCNLLKKALNLLFQLICLPYDIMNHLIESWDSYIGILNNKNPWRKLFLSNKLIIVKSENIPIDKIKRLKNVNKTSFASIINTAICGGMRKYQLLNMSGSLEQFNPNKLHLIVAFPQLSSSSDNLRNHFSFGFMKLPIGESNKKRSLQLINNNIARFRTRYTLLMELSSYFVRFVLGSLPSFLIRMTSFNFISTGALSMLMIPGNELYYKSQKIINCCFVVSTFYGFSGITFSVGSWNQNVQITICVDSKIIPTREKVLELKDLIVKEFDSLEFGDDEHDIIV